MSTTTRIPFSQAFKTQPDSFNTAVNLDEMDPADFVPRDVSAPSPAPSRAGGNGGGGLQRGGNGGGSIMSQRPTQVFRGTRTPQMLEFERQAEERAREQEVMQQERERMVEAEDRIQRDKERIEQEEYEMRQYYQAEALRHADEVRFHEEEVKRHQDRLRAHERLVMDHEASSEAFAKVIAMPVMQAARKRNYYRMPRVGGGSISSSAGSRSGSIDGYNGP